MIGKDKVLHFLAGLICSLIVGVLFGQIAGLISSVIIGAGKEIYDYDRRDKHTPDFMDFVFTALGGVVGLLILIRWM